MKTVLAIFISMLITLPALASVGSSEAGPRVDCKLPSGQSDYIPVMMCNLQGGMKM